MKEPSPHSSRIALAGGLAAILAVGGAGFLLGRGTTERTQIVAAPVAAPLPTPTPGPPPSRGVLGRADLIALAATAADAAASGGAPGADVADADGRRFEIRLPFGCDGPAAEDDAAPMRWRYDAEDEALRLHVAPTMWSAGDWDVAPEGTIRGFWIARPWTSSEACPRGGGRPIGAEPVTLPGQTLAIGQVFAAEPGRESRREGKPYQAVVRVPEGEIDSADGFRLRLSGRIAGTAEGGPVRCRQPAGAEQRPICLIGAVMDEIAIENPATGKTLATWTPGRTEAPAG